MRSYHLCYPDNKKSISRYGLRNQIRFNLTQILTPTTFEISDTCKQKTIDLALAPLSSTQIIGLFQNIFVCPPLRIVGQPQENGLFQKSFVLNLNLEILGESYIIVEFPGGIKSQNLEIPGGGGLRLGLVEFPQGMEK